MQQQLERHDESRQMIIKEVDNLRARFEESARGSTLQPRALGFGNIGSSGTQNQVPMDLDETPTNGRTSRAQDPNETTPSPNHGNVVNNTLTTNSSGFSAGLDPTMARELQKIKDMIAAVPGIIQPIPEASPDVHNLSRFARPIADTEVPRKLKAPNMKSYDGKTDPEEHIVQYRERMEVIPIPAHLKEACLCKGFGSTLTGSALKWLLNLPPYSINSFAHLINLFIISSLVAGHSKSSLVIFIECSKMPTNPSGTSSTGLVGKPWISYILTWPQLWKLSRWDLKRTPRSMMTW